LPANEGGAKGVETAASLLRRRAHRFILRADAAFLPSTRVMTSLGAVRRGVRVILFLKVEA
jgi:hypothetical protein